MTLTMAAHITFPAIRDRKQIDLYRVNSVRIEKSIKEFTGKAEITLPRKVKNFDQINYEDLFQLGDPVIIRLGYGYGEIPVEFEGYINEVTEGAPVRISCEDEMFKLKRGSVSITRSRVTLKELLTAIAPGYQIDCPEVQLGAVRYSQVPPIIILEDLKKEAGLFSFFEGKVLRSGSLYADPDNADPVNVLLERNAVSERLNQKTTSSERIKITAISLLKNGKKLKVEIGDRNGTAIKRTYINIEVRAQLEKEAKKDIEKYKAKGLDGSVVLFGIPRIEAGSKLNLDSEFYKNLMGIFYVDKVVKTFSESGYRQEATLGNKAV